MAQSRLVFATSNKHKIEEANQILTQVVEAPEKLPHLLTLKDINCLEDIPETSDTIAGNALQKARYIYENYDLNCFAEDTGLIIPSLNGEPGVLSARYAGSARDPKKNMNLVLDKLLGEPDRTAYFLTVIALIDKGEEYLFKGKINGTIVTTPRGSKGFGYDPIFQPLGYEYTFAEMDMEEKNKISHRYRALQKFSGYFN